MAHMQEHQGQRLANRLGWLSIGLGAAQMAAPDTIYRLIGRRHPDGSGFMRLVGLREIAAGIGILAAPDPTAGVEARVAGDLIDLAALGRLVGSRAADRPRAVAATAAVLGVTALDLYCLRRLPRESQAGQRQRMTKTISVNRPLPDVYDFWRRLEHFSSLVERLEVDRPPAGRLSRWRLTLPGGREVRWEAVIEDDNPPHSLRWRATAQADIWNAGEVRFEEATGGRGTVVTVDMAYDPPGGKAGAAIAKLFSVEPGQLIETALRRMKQVLETGALVHSDASIHAGMHPAFPPESAKARQIEMHGA